MLNIERIEQFIIDQSIKVSNFEVKIGASNGTIRRAIKNKTDIQSKWITLILDNYPILNATWLLTGKGKMLVSDPYKKEISNKPLILEDSCENYKHKSVPFWDLPVSAGLSLTEIKGKKEADGYIVGLPGADIAENLFPVTGMSMEPEITDGAIIGVRKIDNWETLNTARIYLIITREDRMIKRIEHDLENNDILWCLSPNYARFKIFKSDIIEIQRVCFVYNPK